MVVQSADRESQKEYLKELLAIDFFLFELFLHWKYSIIPNSYGDY